MADTLLPSSLLAPLFSSAAMRAVMDDRARLQRMLDFEAALARAEGALGVIPASASGAIADGCKAERFDLAALAEQAIPVGNVAIPLVAALTAEVAAGNPDAAGYVHWGASNQDVIDTALMLELRAAIDALNADLDRAIKAFGTLAGRHRRTMTVARTQLQQAVPMPFGLKLAGYAAALARSRDRLRRLRKEALAAQFGGSAGTLAALGDKGLDVSERVAALLDLPHPDAPWHSHRDRLAEIASAFAILAGTCGKIARDVALMMQPEIAEASEPAAPGRSASWTPPNTRNPLATTAALSAATIAPNLAASILAAQIQEHERALGWQSEWATFPALALVVSGTLGAVADIAEGLEVDVERMKANLEASGGQVMAEAVAFALAEKLGRTAAHTLTQQLVEKAGKEKRKLQDVLAADERAKVHFSTAEVERLFMPTSYQGAAQTFIDRLIASAQGRALRRPATLSPEFKPRAAETKLPPVAVPAEAVKPPPVAVRSEKAPPSEVPPLAPAKPMPAATIIDAVKPAAVVAAAERPPAVPAAPVEPPKPVAAAAPADPALAAAPATSAAASVPPAATPPTPAETAVPPAEEPLPPATQDPHLAEEPSALLEAFARLSEVADEIARPTGRDRKSG
jgi:3-carboxy-cis,cis-muconate cycloisomerase